MQLSEEQFPVDWRAKIWRAAEGQLSNLVQNGDQLAVILRLPENKLSSTQREQIWTAVTGRLGKLIRNDEELQTLLRLSKSQLSDAQRAQIFGEIKHRKDLNLQQTVAPASSQSSGQVLFAPGADPKITSGLDPKTTDSKNLNTM